MSLHSLQVGDTVEYRGPSDIHNRYNLPYPAIGELIAARNLPTRFLIQFPNLAPLHFSPKYMTRISDSIPFGIKRRAQLAEQRGHLITE